MKTRYGLSQVSMKYLNRNELTQMVHDTEQAVKAFVKTNNRENHLIQQLNKTSGVLTAYKTAQKDLEKKGASGRLEVADLKRDQAFQTLAAFVRAHAYLQTELVQTNYKLLSDLIKDYKASLSKSYEVQSAQVSDLLAKLKTPTYQTAITQLNLGLHVDNLTQAQEQFEAIYKERISEQAALTPGQLKTLRRQVEVNYRLLVDLVAVIAAVQPDHAGYQDLLKTLNAIRRRYRKVKKTKKEVEG